MTNEVKSEITQAEIDAGRRKLAAETVENQQLATLEDAKRFAQNWIETAMQHCANEEYWRGRALEAERRLEEEFNGDYLGEDQ